ncbi:MAG TPA: bestrophin family ion channel [Tahibacter sp.]|uniref:bestrophin family protein n=1 Tax=Tahibacter sp. TaxID=2056211 RepID=UPI002CE1611B|nr:bestrophin family ion channel [Tahibacter sp.]HSX61074.1 bestrophin family ion channel [Tahibacter sp.]
MHTGTSYKLSEFLSWTRDLIGVQLLLSATPVILYELAGFRWLAIPWGVAFLLGTTVALSAGFKNLQTYNRASEAQQIWASITSSSRIWGTLCRDIVGSPLLARELVYRHIAWLAALRHQMREAKPWEASTKPYNLAYAKRHPAESEPPLASELARLVGPDDAARILGASSKAQHVLAMQSSAAKALVDAGTLTPGAFGELQKLIRDFHDQQSRSERIKNFPYPRQHAFINTLFVRILGVILPLGMIGEFERLNPLVDGWAKGHMVWLGIPLSLTICWMYRALDRVGESTENPFEGGANDVPITSICRGIEADLRDLLGESRTEPPTRNASDIAL